MANNKLNDPSRTRLGPDALTGSTSHPQRLDGELQIDPELKEGPASTSRVVMFGAAIVVVLGVVFYGLNNATKAPDATSATATQSTPVAAPPTSTNTAEQSPAPGQSAPTGQSAPNSAVGTTTGSAPPTNTQQPRSTPTGTEVDQDKSSTSNKSTR